MNHWIFGTLIALFGGIGISYVNYRISVYILGKNSSLLNASSPARQILNIGYLVAVYFLAPYTPWDRIAMLVAAVIGVTGSLFYFTYRLVRHMDAQKNDKEVSDKDKTDTASET